MKPSLYLAVSFLWTGSLLAQAIPRHAISPNGVGLKAGEEVPIAAGGKALVPIVISPGASELTEKSANTLAEFLGKITGATFVVERSPSPAGITLGTLGEFPDASLNEALKIGEWNDGREAFAIRTGGKVIRLLGASDLATQHAAYRFLELLGVRRYFSGSAWEVIPRKANLAFDAEEDSRPKVLSRRIWMAFGVPKHSQENFNAWRNHNRQGESLRVVSSHIYQAVYQRNREEFDANKEAFYAEVKGKKDRPGKYNLANPRVRELIMETAMSSLKEGDTGPRMISIEPSDGAYWSEDEANRALGTISDRAFGLANELAGVLDKKGLYDVHVGMLAYYLHSQPPAADLHPRVHVLLTTRMNHGPYDLPQLKELWSKKTSNLGLYDYYSTYVWGQERIRDVDSYSPAADPEKVAADLDEYINDLKIRSFLPESLDNWALYGPGYYVSAQKSWDPRSSVQALLSDFYEKAFGPAQEPIRQFYELLYPSSGRTVDYSTVRKLMDKLDEAGIAAASDAPAKERVDLLKQYMHSFMLTFRGMGIEDEEEDRKLDVEYYNYIYRTRKTQMMGSVPQLTLSAPKVLKVEKKERPWEHGEAPTPEEVAMDFANDLAWIRSLGEPVDAVRFSEDYVEVSLGEQLMITPSTSMALTLVIKEEGPVTLEFEASAAKGKEIGYDLKSLPDRQKIASGNIPGREEKGAVKIKLPSLKPGSYVFDFRHQVIISQWPDTAPAVAIVNEPGRSGSFAAINQSAYFYVPKGTKEIIAYRSLNVRGNNNAKVTLFGPDNYRHDAEVTYGIARIPVHDGDDGKLWSFPKGKGGGVYFYNIPNVYSIDQNRAVLPREVAVADGLIKP